MRRTQAFEKSGVSSPSRRGIWKKIKPKKKRSNSMKQMWIAAIAGMFIVSMAGVAFAADMSQGMGQEMDMAQPGHEGNTIHSSDVEGYHMTYQLYELTAAEGAQPAHHLMVTITDQDGKPVENATVGYIVTGPDGKEQKLMTMGMGGGYGANLDLSLSGDYVIKTKVVAGDKKVIDSFTYTVE